MANEEPMTRLELIQLVGDVITVVDVARSRLARETKERMQLDGLRDELDTAQRKFVRNVFGANTEEFANLTARLKRSNQALKTAIEDVESTAESLEVLVKLVGTVQKLAGLII